MTEKVQADDVQSASRGLCGVALSIIVIHFYLAMYLFRSLQQAYDEKCDSSCCCCDTHTACNVSEYISHFALSFRSVFYCLLPNLATPLQISDFFKKLEKNILRPEKASSYNVSLCCFPDSFMV